MSAAGVVTYNIQYQPDKYTVREHRSSEVTPGTPHYWSIVSEATGREVAFAFDEPTAKTICLAMELVRSQVYGDTKRATQLLRLIDKLSQGALFKEG